MSEDLIGSNMQKRISLLTEHNEREGKKPLEIASAQN